MKVEQLYFCVDANKDYAMNSVAVRGKEKDLSSPFNYELALLKTRERRSPQGWEDEQYNGVEMS
jgi:hypothetical protein